MISKKLREGIVEIVLEHDRGILSPEGAKTIDAILALIREREDELKAAVLGAVPDADVYFSGGTARKMGWQDARSAIIRAFEAWEGK